ncbi:MAG: T9SS type A sorting domain-containing protein, partial [Bacteroidota bacterium]
YEGSCGNMVASHEVQTTSVQITPELSLVPNPAKDLVSLRFKQKEARTIQLKVMNAMGQAVLQTRFAGQIGENQYDLNISDLAVGAYFVVINDGYQTQTKRLLIQR